MSKAHSNLCRIVAVSFISAGCLAVLLPASGAEPTGGTGTEAQPTQAPRPRTAQEVLIQKLVARGALTPEDAAELLKLNEADQADARVQSAMAELAAAQAAAAKARAEAVNPQKPAVPSIPATAVAAAPAPTQVPHPAPADTSRTNDGNTGTVQFVPPTPVTTPSATATASSATPSKSGDTATAQDDNDDTVRVTYVPEAVKNQLREEIKNDVMQQAKDERWAAPRSVPEWVSRLNLYGDFRFRFESIYNHKQNDDSGNFPNFNAINTGSPFDTLGSTASPQLNVDQDRARVRVRARLGMVADLGEGFTTGLRFATGENNSPVSQNQSLGAAGSGQGGDFSKYALWLDRAYLRYQSEADLSKAISVTVGRFENPFLSTSVIWADDLGFDGGVVTVPLTIHFDGAAQDWVRPYIVGGAFPIFNTDLNYATNSSTKTASNDKWLEAAQAGIDLKVGDDWKVKCGLGYYYFTKTVGKLSTTYSPLTSSDAGDTDARRPSFAQKGNTYMELRSIQLLYNSSGTLINSLWQYYGLASEFRDVTYDFRIDYNHFSPFQVSLIGEYVDNVGFNREKITLRSPVNNLGGASGEKFIGSGTAWIAGVRLGDAVLQKRWDWTVNFNYREVGSDSVIDGFCDSDFGGGGTNVKGYTVGVNVALARWVNVGVKWMASSLADLPSVQSSSSTSTSSSGKGNDVKTDILQFDLNAKF